MGWDPAILAPAMPPQAMLSRGDACLQRKLPDRARDRIPCLQLPMRVPLGYLYRPPATWAREHEAH